jgi:hypothetical protein
METGRFVHLPGAYYFGSFGPIASVVLAVLKVEDAGLAPNRPDWPMNIPREMDNSKPKSLNFFPLW